MPVIVVGNIAVGGTGKTPLVIRLVGLLRAAGWRPGVISRGYGGQARIWPQPVTSVSEPERVGDEPVMIVQRTGCPMWVGPDRVAAAQALLAAEDCDILVADDGLQHYRLYRQWEIGVLDGVRRLGNGHCLPLGPLREPAARWATLTWRVTNGEPATGEWGMQLVGDELVHLHDRTRCQPLIALAGQRVHAVAGIGHPERFFNSLRQAGLAVVAHPFGDHHRFTMADLANMSDAPLIMTDKDAVKCHGFAPANAWRLPVVAQLAPAFEAELLTALERLSDG